MFKAWGRIIKENKTVRETVAAADDAQCSRTRKVFAALELICENLDLAQPVWLESNITEFQRRGMTRFGKDNFIEAVDFDYLDFRIIEEDTV